jgi:DNA-binding transcriptional ArsR family regulator
MRNHMATRSADAAFYALADPTRRAVLDLLRDGGQPAGTIAKAFPVSRPAISKHLRLLLEANLVSAHSRGRQRVYRLNPQPLTAVDAWLGRYRQFWSAKLTDLKGFVESGRATPTRPGRSSRRS